MIMSDSTPPRFEDGLGGTVVSIDVSKARLDVAWGNSRLAARPSACDCSSNHSFVLERPRRGALRYQHRDGE